jgi:hypothetical protein
MLDTLEDYRKAAEHAAELVTLLMPGNRAFPPPPACASEQS